MLVLLGCSRYAVAVVESDASSPFASLAVHQRVIPQAELDGTDGRYLTLELIADNQTLT